MTHASLLSTLFFSFFSPVLNNIQYSHHFAKEGEKKERGGKEMNILYN